MYFEKKNRDEILNYLDEIANWRIQYFKVFPYLYQGNLEYEKKYLESFAKTTFATVALAFDNDKLVGFATNAIKIRNNALIFNYLYVN